MTHLKPKDKAPAFSTVDQDGNKVSLKDFKGKKVALYFYPHDDSETCNKQACNIRDNYALLKQKGIEILGVSIDDQKSHKKFEKKFSLPFRILVDTDKKMVNDYGIWGEKLFMGRIIVSTYRTTFLINEKGKIDHIIEKVVSGKHAQQIIETWETPDP
ncbi:MAG: thioredoxin-dependent thiol peroxidase [Flavipsychrobacter sp.]|jgi:peroxiredoxin Q/BCP|nr:thioredoxin-dependent thiol peroxidase [Flavipsychrobacter sp.]